MSTTAILIGWWICGVVGGLLLWRDWRNECCATRRCPTPYELVLIVVGGIGGPPMLVSGLFFVAYRSPHDWWNTPICKDREP